LSREKKVTYLPICKAAKFIVFFVACRYAREKGTRRSLGCGASIGADCSWDLFWIIREPGRRLGQMPPSRRLRVESKHRRQKRQSRS